MARRKIQIIFQDPYSSLNPRLRAGAIGREPMDLMDVGAPSERDGRVAELFRRVGLRPEQRALFPHQFSGGQRQRIGVVRALASRPEVIVCDEPVSALDVAIQAQILIAVMYLGQVVEQADRVALFAKPLHPYTHALLSAVPTVQHRDRVGRIKLRGDPPSPIDPPPGCRFAARCPFAEPRCRVQSPALRPIGGGGHKVACHLVGDDGVAPHRRVAA